MIRNVVFLIFLFLFFGCRKEIIDDQKFYVTYVSINNGADDLMRMNVHSYTHYPVEDIGIYIGQGKDNVNYAYFEEEYLEDQDTIILKPDREVYPGCISYMDVELYIALDKSIIEYRKYAMAYDTIKTNEDADLLFRCPDDSLHHNKLRLIDSKIYNIDEN